MALFLANVFNKLYGYAIMLGLFAGALFYSYSKGRRDSFNESVRRTLEQDVAGRQQADSIRSSVDGAGNVDERLQRWTRDRS